MVIPRDKLLHIGLGLLWLCATAVNLLVFTLFGLGPALAYGTTVFGILYEVNQWVAPTPMPKNKAMYFWSEAALSWVKQKP